MAEFLKGLSVFLMCMVYPGKAGVPSAIVLFHHDLVKVLLVCTAGGIFGNILFTYMSAWILKQIHTYRVKNHLIHKRKIFTKFNRIIVKIKQRFGLTGIAFISPMFLSIPVGAFLAERFFKHKKKIIIYFSVSLIFWEFTLYLISKLF